MGWSVDWWDGIAQFFGYDEWNWGSAADWFAAIGTVGALLLGLYLLAADRRRARGATAASVITNVSLLDDPGDDHNWYVEVDALNMGNSPVADGVTWVHVRNLAGHELWHRRSLSVKRSSKSGQSDAILKSRQIMPTEVASASIQVDISSDVLDCYVSFADQAGIRWMRDVKNGLFVDPETTMPSFHPHVKEGWNGKVTPMILHKTRLKKPPNGRKKRQRSAAYDFDMDDADAE